MPGKKMMSPLSVAASRGILSATKLLIAAGADVDDAMTFRPDSEGRTDSFYQAHPLAVQAALDAHEDPANELRAARMQDGKDFELQAAFDRSDLILPEGATPLMFAVVNNQLEVAEYLLSAGAMIDAAASDGTTALMLAATHDQPRMIELLLGHDVLSKHAALLQRGELDFPLSKLSLLPTGWFKMVDAEKLHSPQTFFGIAAQTLIAWGGVAPYTQPATWTHCCNVDAVNSVGQSALMLAAKRSSVMSVVTLLFYKAFAGYGLHESMMLTLKASKELVIQATTQKFGSDVLGVQ